MVLTRETRLSRSAQSTHPWLLALLALTAVLLLPTTLSLLRMWNSFGSRFYTFGDLVLLLAVAALMRRRKAVDRSRSCVNPVAMALLIPAGIVWLLLYRSNIQVAHQASFPVLLWLATFAAFGAPVARLCLFPLAYLMFAVPIWEWLIAPLQQLTIAAMRVLLPLTGISAQVVGNLVHIPAGTFEIQGGCAGQSYLLVALALAASYADQHRATRRSQLGLLALAAALAIVGNWCRVAGVIIAGQLTAMQSYLVRVSHDEFGWAIFAVVMLVFIAIAPRLTETQEEAPSAHAAGPAPRRLRSVVGALALLAVGPVLGEISTTGTGADRPELPLLHYSDGWFGPTNYEGAWQPYFAGAAAQQMGIYRTPSGESVTAFSAFYVVQDAHGKLHGHDNRLLNDDAFVVIASHESSFSALPYTETEFQDRAGSHYLVFALYKAGPHVVRSAVRAQLWFAVRSLGRLTPTAVIAIQTHCQPDCAAARTRLKQFMADSRWLAAPAQLGVSSLNSRIK